MKRGHLIVFEGIDGSGKTTISKWLVELLNNSGYKALYTYEPTRSIIVEDLKKHYNDVRSAILDALIYAADRIIHLEREVKPALDKGYIVVMDRYYYSSVAYQGAMGASVEWVIELNRYALKPDLAIYIDVDPETGLKRVKGKKNVSRFPEYEKLELLKRVRQIYLELVRRGYLVMIDGRRDIEEVKRDVLSIVRSSLNLRL